MVSFLVPLVWKKINLLYYYASDALFNQINMNQTIGIQSVQRLTFDLQKVEDNNELCI